VSRDWSSDVCSSDLSGLALGPQTWRSDRRLGARTGDLASEGFGLGPKGRGRGAGGGGSTPQTAGGTPGAARPAPTTGAAPTPWLRPRCSWERVVRSSERGRSAPGLQLLFLTSGSPHRRPEIRTRPTVRLVRLRHRPPAPSTFSLERTSSQFALVYE